MKWMSSENQPWVLLLHFSYHLHAASQNCDAGDGILSSLLLWSIYLSGNKDWCPKLLAELVLPTDRSLQQELKPSLSQKTEHSQNEAT